MFITHEGLKRCWRIHYLSSHRSVSRAFYVSRIFYRIFSLFHQLKTRIQKGERDREGYGKSEVACARADPLAKVVEDLNRGAPDGQDTSDDV